MKKKNSQRPPLKKNTNGKGDSPRSNISKEFRNNFDSIFRKFKKK